MKFKTRRYGFKHRKCELLRAIEIRLLIEQLEEAVTAFRYWRIRRQNRRTAAELERRGML